MTGTPNRRHDIRLPGYDYSSPGVYHVIMTLKERRPLFGNVHESGMILNDIGRMIQDEWQKLPVRFPWLSLDDLVVMPDHLHGLLVLGADPEISERTSLGEIVGAFKSLTTRRYGQGVRIHNWPQYRGTLWLENYFERIVRNDRELEKFRNYIADNPYRLYEKHLNQESNPGG